MVRTSHLKRHAMPTSWNVKRKNIQFISRPNPGRHKREYAVSVIVLLREILGYTKNTKETVYAVKNTEIMINGTRVKDVKETLGLFDVIEIKSTSEKFVVLFDEVGKIKLIPTKDDTLVAKVAGKKTLGAKKYQLNLFNGYNILVDEKTFKKVKVNDSVVYDFVKKKVVEHVELKDGVFVYIFDGKFKGQFAQVKSFTLYNGLARDLALIEIASDSHNTAKDYCYPVSAKKEDIKKFN